MRQRRRDPVVRELLTDANDCSLAAATGSGASGGGRETGSLMKFSAQKQLVLPNVSDELDENAVPSLCRARS